MSGEITKEMYSAGLQKKITSCLGTARMGLGTSRLTYGMYVHIVGSILRRLADTLGKRTGGAGDGEDDAVG
jgi:hypothetical protein